MTTVTWAWKLSNHVEEVWDEAINWSTGELPGPGDDVVMPTKTACEFGSRTSDTADIKSLDVQGSLGIDGGEMSITKGLTLGASGGLEIDDPLVASGNSSSPRRSPSAGRSIATAGFESEPRRASRSGRSTTAQPVPGPSADT